jgi:hypothetical protein
MLGNSVRSVKSNVKKLGRARSVRETLQANGSRIQKLCLLQNRRLPPSRQAQVVDRAGHRVSDDIGASGSEGASRSESELGNGLERQDENGQAPIKDETRIAWEE